jgi:phosphomannomutase
VSTHLFFTHMVERMIRKPQEQLLFSVAGARGIVGAGLTVDVVTRLSLAFCAILPPGAVVIGRDTRPSGKSLQMAAMAAVTAAGRECVDLGVATTPTVELMVEKLGASGGMVVTASHNSAEWNALKFLDRRGIFIPQNVSKELHATYESGRFAFADAASTGTHSSYDRSARDHIDAILELHSINIESIRHRAFRIVLDCINGAGSVIAPELLEALGVHVIPMNCKTDGDFYRDPEPRPENLVDLAEAVRKQGADLGFALDPDADRLSTVDDTGKALSEEFTLALAVDHVLTTEKKGPVVVNLSTSALVEWIAGRHQTKVLRTPVGEAHVVDTMLRESAPIGGEGNGGVIYPELHPGRDALLGMAFVLQLLADRVVALSDQIKQYPPFYMKKEKIPLEGDFSKEKISSLMQGLEPDNIDTRDGVRAVFHDGWLHVRVSNTEGVVRMIAESLSEDRTAALLASTRRALEASWNR